MSARSEGEEELMKPKIDNETYETACGPLQFDIRMARDFGWSEELIREVDAAMILLVRGAIRTHAITNGTNPALEC